MTDQTPEDQRATIVDVFLDVVGPRRKAKHAIDDEDFVAMLQRMHRALLVRGIGNPAIILLMKALAEELTQSVNIVVAANADRYAVDKRLGASINEMAPLLNVSRQATSQRRATGNRAMIERIEAAGVTVHSEARREREIREAASAEAAVVLVDFLARRRTA